jgi:hypothetical protein
MVSETQPLVACCVLILVAMAWLNLVLCLLIAIAGGVLVGVVLDSLVGGGFVAVAIFAGVLWQRHYRWMIRGR